jgi:hypothetical protein
MTTPAHPDPDAIWREWMKDLLSTAAARFGLTITGTPIYGWCDRSIGAEAASPKGGRWLRVVTEDARWAHGDFWTGNADAGAIKGITKPTVLDTAEWEQGPRKVRAEHMTLLHGQPCSPTDVLSQEARLPQTWWSELRRSLDVLAATPTRRVCVSSDHVVSRVRNYLGVDLDPDTLTWTTIHGDLHWANLDGPRFALLDWEGWGRGPTGVDAATLYCYSLLLPNTARRVFETFRDVLDSPTGTVAQLYAIARLLSRAEKGDYPDLVEPLRNRAALLTTAEPTRS